MSLMRDLKNKRIYAIAEEVIQKAPLSSDSLYKGNQFNEVAEDSAKAVKTNNHFLIQDVYKTMVFGSNILQLEQIFFEEKDDDWNE